MSQHHTDTWLRDLGREYLRCCSDEEENSYILKREAERAKKARFKEIDLEAIMRTMQKMVDAYGEQCRRKRSSADKRKPRAKLKDVRFLIPI